MPKRHRALLVSAGATLGFWGTAVCADDQVPVPWDGMDIGGPNPAGGATEAQGTFTLTAAGGDISGRSDQFHYIYQSITGDFALVARVTNGTGQDEKAGLMVRDALAATSNDVAILDQSGQRVLYQYRTMCWPQGNKDTADASGPIWLRLVKRGTT